MDCALDGICRKRHVIRSTICTPDKMWKIHNRVQTMRYTLYFLIMYSTWRYFRAASVVVTGGLRFGMAICDKDHVYRDKKSVSDRSRAYGSAIREKVNCYYCAIVWATPVNFGLVSLLTARRNILQACFTVSLRTSPSRKWWWKSSAGGMVICALLDILH